MKKPYFNLEQRRLIHHDTLEGNKLMLHLGFQKLFRDTTRTKGWIGLVKLKLRLERALKLKP